MHEIILEREQIDLSYMLNQMADEFYPMLQAHKNTIRVVADESLTISADPDKLARVFNNILKNAIAYSYTETPIKIEATATEHSVLVTITNSGKTIPKQKMDSIFEKFYRLDDARSSHTGGAGLGLAIAKEIILQHGGSITAISSDQTTTFNVELPLGHSGSTAQLRLQISANLLHQFCSFKNGKYIQYSRAFETLTWHKISG